MKRMKLSDIKISESFALTVPKESKMDECRKNWEKTGQQDRYIVVNKDGVLIDGYIQYLILKENNVDDVMIRVSNRRRLNLRRRPKSAYDPAYRNKETMYIFGHHPNDVNAKTYVWRVPETWNDFRECVRVGDSVNVETKFGDRCITVDKIEVLDSCPVRMPVKTMANKLIIKK
jgi:hypothetical protein